MTGVDDVKDHLRVFPIEYLTARCVRRERRRRRRPCRRAGEPLDVARAAAALGLTRQTLRNHLVRHGLPRPQTFLVWCRLLAAASLLDERGRTLDSVALQLNFSSGQNLGAALRRYVGANITTLRFGEVSPAIEAEFRRIIQRGLARAEAQRASLPRHTPKD